MKRNVTMFSVGAVGYGLLELLWRGYTHWSMPVAGGICFSAFGFLAQRFQNTRLLVKGLLGGTLITAVEFLFGVVFNLVLKKNIWDYSKFPLHILGQICPRYTGLWMLLSIPVFPFAGNMYRRLNTKKVCK